MKTGKSFNEIFGNLSGSERNKTALVCGKESYTYGGLDHAIDLFASELLDMGVRPMDRVGIWSFNSANAIIAFFGTVRAGAVAVLCNYSLNYEEAKELLSDCRVSYLLYGKNLANRNAPELSVKLADELGVKGSLDISPEKISFNRNDEVSHAKEIEELKEKDDACRDAFIIFTTGSTSKPKAVRNHQNGLMVNAERFAEKRGPFIGDDACISLPFFHVFGLHMLVSNLLKRAAVYYNDKVGADSIVSTLLEYNCTNIYTVTPVYLKVIEHKDFSRICRQVRSLTTGGGSLTPVQFMKIEMAFPGAKLFNEYGQSETHGSIAMCDCNDSIEKRAFTVGRPYSRSEVVIIGADNEIVKDGEPGEIAVRNAAVTNGYDGIPADEQPVDENGYLRTGDLGVYDGDGYIRLVGRAKDLIIKNGENIAPAEVENAVAELPGVEEVKVYGVRHNLWGESVECCLRLAKGAEFDEAGAVQTLKSRLASVKIPNHFIVFDSFPAAPSGKLDARALRILLVNRLKDMYIREELDAGIEIFSLRIKSAEYNIVPASAMLRSVAESLGFDPVKTDRIALAVEEFLLLRIVENTADVGDIKISCIFHLHYLTIEFADNGENYYIEKNTETSLCAKLIVAVADNVNMITSADAPTRYTMDFFYPREIDIKEFLLSKDHSRL